MTQEPPRKRVTVTNPRTAAPRSRGFVVAQEIDSQTRLGEVYVRSLVRTQLRLAMLVCTVVGVVLGALPLLFLFLPQINAVRVLGLPLPWLLLGFLVYPLLIGVAAYYVRHAERNERDFSDLVGRGE
ncbi:MAG: hypothetical protein GEV10_14120 [Streptosporangiales bacterium]|nr:hypothetical protein [Streptosporangiales bacterium]